MPLEDEETGKTFPGNQNLHSNKITAAIFEIVPYHLRIVLKLSVDSTRIRSEENVNISCDLWKDS